MHGCSTDPSLEIIYNWDKNHWIFNLKSVENSLIEHKVSTDPSNPEFLLSHLRELPEDARKYIVWASLFGST
jgi:hypothetical protein